MSSPLVEAKDLVKIFDVSAPWLNRVVERKPKMYVHAVDGVDALIVTCAIDNLLKGAASQAVQNLNLLLGCAETEGLV